MCGDVMTGRKQALSDNGGGYVFPKKLYAFLRRIGQKIVYQSSARVLSQDKLVLFSSSPKDKFGNITALATKLREKRIPFLWLTREELILHPFRAFITFAKARVLVVDAAPPSAYVKLSRNSTLIYCWHACGAYKKVGFDAKRRDRSDASEERRIQRIHGKIDYFVCSSEEVDRILAKAFRLPQEKMLVFGSPRLDTVIREADFPTPPTYTVLYAPTYRTHAGKRHLPTVPEANILRKSLRSRLGEDVRLVFRGHPTAPVPDDLRGWEDWSNLPQQEALRKASVLITDYSSIFFDYLPFNRPIIFYVPDFEDYQIHERGLYFSPYDLFPETTCADEDGLLRLLENYHCMAVDYKPIWQKYMSACDGNATERLCAFIQKHMSGETP